jgi:tetratricopeptide (TPR) repeat protein
MPTNEPIYIEITPTFGASFLDNLVEAVAVVGVFIALIFVVLFAIAVVSSIYRVAAGKAILILPLEGAEDASSVTQLLHEQLENVEANWTALASRAAGATARSFVRENLSQRPGPTARLMADHLISEQSGQGKKRDAIASQAISLNVAGVSVVPDAVVALFYRIRSHLARSTIRGSYYELGSTARLSLSVRYKPPSDIILDDATRADLTRQRPRESRRRPRVHLETVSVVRELHDRRDLLDLVDDVAFAVNKHVHGMYPEPERWRGYESFLKAYTSHIAFLESGDLSYREEAIRLYMEALAVEPEYARAHYNLALLLYNYYEEIQNGRAIEHFEAASASSDARLKALALSGLTLAYGQNVFRFGMGPHPYVDLADEVSARALAIEEKLESPQKLEECALARGWALQLARKYDDALDWYGKAIDMPTDTPVEQQLQSFALNNRGYIYMTEFGNDERAEADFLEANRVFRNKMAFANLGTIYCRQSRFGLALASYKRARSLDPTYANAFNETGMVLLAKAWSEVDHTKPPSGALVSEADNWHRRALSLVPLRARHQRAEMVRLFQAQRAKLDGVTQEDPM